jgi:hypothetical protein
MMLPDVTPAHALLLLTHAPACTTRQALRALPALYDIKKAAWAPLQLLTDGEMLRLLAAASHPPAVQALVPRLYSGGLGSCRALMFEPDGAISGLLGGGGSMLQFVQSVYPAAYGE